MGKRDYFYEVLSQMSSVLISLETNTIFNRQNLFHPLFGIGEIEVLRF